MLPPIQMGNVTEAQIQAAVQARGGLALDPASASAIASLAASTPAASSRARSEELLRDIINLADEAARLALGPPCDSEETEDEEFM